MEKLDFNDLIKKAKANNQSKTMQKVVPIISKEIDETQFSFYIEKKLLKRLKIKALDEDCSVKKLINKSIEDSLN
ncbi:hypothetical protein [Polaribacter glomeratus]|uniref:Uncharacterized protein n=1 Tax=Polaribacter glomeratus TaxID=102 RepID=A0A2S7WYH7_9FLAO|nr:hypothetical protein [Polaribacter glomeratus]PQJ82615.1 hypothetical protein BTO16_08515 [Polaribacter glomeratus]TXD64929.1 hypothetical protein ESX12_12350 [Polaribacter glomeratus]